MGSLPLQFHTRQQNRNGLHINNNEGFRRIQKAIGKLRSTTDPDNHVVNLTKKAFTKDQFKLLNKNLNFIPNPGNFNKKNFKNVLVP